MTYEELHAIAAKRGTVRWDKSGLIEHLELTKDSKVLARPIKQPKKHIIRDRPKNLTGDRPWTYACIEVDPKTKEPIHATVAQDPQA